MLNYESNYDVNEGMEIFMEKMIEYGKYINENNLENTEENYNNWLEITDRYIPRDMKRMMIKAFLALADIENQEVKVICNDKIHINIGRVDKCKFQNEFCNGLSIHMENDKKEKYNIRVYTIKEYDNGDVLDLGKYKLIRYTK